MDFKSLVKITIISLKKNRSFNFLDLMSFVGNFIVTYGFFLLSIYFSEKVSLQQGQILDDQQWKVIFIAPILLVVFTYLREVLAVRKKQRQIYDRKVIYDCIGGAIEQLIELKSKPKAERASYVNELLKYIEKVIQTILREDGIEPGELCTNLMITKTNPDHLKLEYFGTFLSGRERLKLPIDYTCPKPGAPEAYVLKKVTYVDDTTSETFQKYFDSKKPYRSIISIPIVDAEGNIFAIMNIDSNIPKQFVSVDYINKKILTTINPLIDLVKLVKDDIVNNVGKTKQNAKNK